MRSRPFIPITTRRSCDHYVTLAGALGLLMTGGSDFHGDPAHGSSPGSVTLPEAEWQRLSCRSAAP